MDFLLRWSTGGKICSLSLYLPPVLARGASMRDSGGGEGKLYWRLFRESRRSNVGKEERAAEEREEIGRGFPGRPTPRAATRIEDIYAVVTFDITECIDRENKRERRERRETTHRFRSPTTISHQRIILAMSAAYSSSGKCQQDDNSKQMGSGSGSPSACQRYRDREKKTT